MYRWDVSVVYMDTPMATCPALLDLAPTLPYRNNEDMNSIRTNENREIQSWTISENSVRRSAYESAMSSSPTTTTEATLSTNLGISSTKKNTRATATTFPHLSATYSRGWVMIRSTSASARTGAAHKRSVLRWQMQPIDFSEVPWYLTRVSQPQIVGQSARDRHQIRF